MIVAEATAVRASRADAWAIWTDAARWPQWDPEVTRSGTGARGVIEPRCAPSTAVAMLAARAEARARSAA